MFERKIYLVALHIIWFNQRKLFEIFSKQDDYELFFQNLNFNNLASLWFNKIKIEEILKAKENINLSYIQNKLEELKVEIITLNENSYPKSLKHIFNPPYLLYVRWKIIENGIAFVWSRKMTSYWEKAIEKLVPEIGKHFSIISWWAIWCDTKSHKIALENNIKTISIIWTWIDKTYPRENKELYEQIIQNSWAIISIFPLWAVWHPSHFPIRNEIVVWLSLWVVVIEAQKKSGSLITAQLWLDLWKDVFALPWEIFKSNSEWTNRLIAKHEAKIILSAEDILNEYEITQETLFEFNSSFLSDDIERAIYDSLRLESLNIDSLAKKLSIWLNELLLKLSILELSMLIKRWANWNYEIV